MDRVIEKKTWTKKRILTIIGVVGIVGLAAASYYFTSGKSRLNVDTERIAISEVKKGTFQENIPVNGTVLPLTSIFLETQEGGQVEERYVEDGTIMKKGQPIVRLSNTNLLMNMMSSQNTVYNTLTQMQINRNAAQQNTVNKLTQMADVESYLKEAERVYNLNKKLYEQKAIGLQEFKKSENDYNYYRQKEYLARQILKADTISTKQQQLQDKQTYEGSQNALAIMKKKVEDLIVRSPVDGQLTSLDAEVGQTKAPGARIGQIDVLGGFKVRVDVDEHYLSRIYTGLKGTFTFADTLYNLEIQKVYSQIVNGRFQVDMVFKGKAPKGIRRGQTLQILLSLSDARQALLLPKGGFYQQTGGNWIFKVNENGTLATKQDIQLGNMNTDYYEVLNGLQPGDKVVTSSYENYGTMQELVLKK
ncbi:MAG: HlyD family efflux transporter periplasmic adaptor subunit [Bacteroidetes bacterium]|nr:HlyD family efflux transporter periplasmic adaptor subunit [Bacteroidota bacterium]